MYLTVLLMPCSSDSHLTRESESPASEQQSLGPDLFSICQGSRTTVSVLFLPFVLFSELCRFEAGSSTLVPALPSSCKRRGGVWLPQALPAPSAAGEGLSSVQVTGWQRHSGVNAAEQTGA